MQKILFSILILFSMKSCPLNGLGYDFSFLGRVTALSPLGGAFQKIYGHGGFAYGLEFDWLVADRVELYTTWDDFTRRGRSTGGEKTTVHLFPVNMGVKYYVPFGRCRFYVGGGPLLLLLQVRNETDLVPKETKRGDLGGTLKFGGAMMIKQALLDLFIEYSYQKMYFAREVDNVQWHNVDLSHIKIGAALGVRF